MNRTRLLVLILSTLQIKGALCGNILIIDEVPASAHQIFNAAIAEDLAVKGHNVTIIMPNSIKLNESSNLHVILFEGLHELSTKGNFYDPENLSAMGPLANTWLFIRSSSNVCNFITRTKGAQTLLNYPKDFKFDLIILDMTLETCLLPMIQRFNYPPAIATTPFALTPYLGEIFGSCIQPSYLPFYTLRLSENMSFLERLQNHFWMRFETFMRVFFVTGRVEKISKTVFGEGMDSFEKLRRHVSLLVCNLITGFHHSQSLPANIIAAGGLHVKQMDKLPKDLQEIMDNAKHGVILVIFGSNVRSDSFRPEKKEAFLAAFSQVKETVIWKYESELNDLPKNIITRKWIPQAAVLAHPKTKLFIGHGGGMSVTEAVFFGVPILGMPFIVDQHSNMDLMVQRGVGRKMDFRSITASSLLENIKEMLEDPKYKRASKELSKRVRDRPQSPLDLATFWVEFAMKHNGTHFLEPRSRDLSLFVSSSTDVYSFVTSLILIFFYVSYKTICLLLKGYLCKPKKHKVKKN